MVNPIVLVLLGCADPAVSTPGLDPAVPAGPGEVRAGIVAEGSAGEAALFGGVNAEGRAGDIKLYNDRIQVIIQAARPGNGYVDIGGHIIDVDRVREGSLGRDTVEDIFLAFGQARLVQAETVEILADGSEGGAAVVCARGRDVPWAFFQGLLELDEPLVDELNLSVVTTYTLYPDSDTVEIVSELTNTGDEDITFQAQDGVFASGEDLLPWAPGRGLEGPDTGVLEAMAFTGRRGEATFSIWPVDDSFEVSVFSQLAADLGIFLADHPAAELAPGETLTLRRGLSVAPDAAGTEAARWAAQGLETGTVSGLVALPDGTGVPGVRVHFVDGDGAAAAFATTGADGSYSAALPPGSWSAWAVGLGDDEVVDLPEGAGRYAPWAAESVNAEQLAALSGEARYEPLPFAAGHSTPEPVDFVLDAGGLAAADLEVQPAGTLQVRIEDDGGAALPGVIELRWSEGAPERLVPDALRGVIGVPSSSRAAWAWTADGAMSIPVEPGTYDVSAGHSWRYERQTATRVQVEAGQTAAVTLRLREVVPRDGWLAVDSHLHASPSFDGALPMEDRLIACAATGVDLPVSTDHDALAEYRELAGALGLDGRLQVIPGVEVTTLLRGHFNLYPVEPEPTEQLNGGAEPWWETPATTQELFDRMREGAGPDALIQVNHPRSPGMFAFASYDPESGQPGEADLWSWDFQVFELLNGGVDTLESLREDWFGMLNHGDLRVPVGVSDSHYRYIPCGMGRTDLYLDAADPAAVSPSDIREALLSGRVVVASGVTLRAEVDGALPGSVISTGEATLTANVIAPSWVVPGTLRVYMGGDVLYEEALPDDITGGYQVSVPLRSGRDTWVVVEVQGEVSQGDMWRGTPPYAATNAFFLDVDGGGWAPE